MRRMKKFAVIARISLANAVTYRVSLLSRFCFYTLFIYIFMSLWRAIYKEGEVHGYTYAQIVWYLVMTEFIGFACGTNVLNTMNADVKSGAIAYQLGRPVHYVLYQMASTLGQVLLNIFSFGILAVILGLVFVGPLGGFTVLTLPPLILSVALGILLHFFIMMLIGLSAFVMEDNFALYLIYQKATFMLGMFLPVEFLPAWLQRIAVNLPFSYVFWAPAKIFVDYSPGLALELLPRQGMWAAAAVVLTFLCYRFSVRRLQVNGG